MERGMKSLRSRTPRQAALTIAQWHWSTNLQCVTTNSSGSLMLTLDAQHNTTRGVGTTATTVQISVAMSTGMP